LHCATFIMKTIAKVGVGSLVLLLGALGCGDSNHSDNDDSEDLSHLTPAELCQRKCDLEVAADCANVPDDYGPNCALLCQAKYQKFPNCSAAASALDACAIQRVTYSCENGALHITPEGACAAAGNACISCTGSLFDCL
jgi:hypothetical protein